MDAGQGGAAELRADPRDRTRRLWQDDSVKRLTSNLCYVERLPVVDAGKSMANNNRILLKDIVVQP